MFGKLMRTLREDVYLIIAAFWSFAGSAWIGSLTVDAESTTPGIWLACMWVMLAVGAVIIIGVIVECVLAVLGRD